MVAWWRRVWDCPLRTAGWCMWRIMLTGLTMGAMATAALAGEFRGFAAAKAVWASGREKEMNLQVGFVAAFEASEGQKVTVRVGASTMYRFWVNGEFAGYGPARGSHGYYRVDEWDISDKLIAGRNHVAIEVAGYNVNSFATLDQPSFLQAEVVSGQKVLASTGSEGASFRAGVLPYRVQKVQRYSFQRAFTEVYRLRGGYDGWRRGVAGALTPAELAVVGEKKLLARGVPLPEYGVMKRPVRLVSEGRVEPRGDLKDLWKDRSLTGVGPRFKGYPEKELEVSPSIEAQKLATQETAKIDRPYPQAQSLKLGEKSCRIVDFGANCTGFIRARIRCDAKSRVWLVFDEILSGDDVDFKRLSCVNIVDWQLEPGTYEVETFEPYTLRYLKIISVEGECEVSGIGLRECAYPAVPEAKFAASDERLNKLFAAGVETFRQNSLDIFMDCPSRERAGWLCDSFFTARAACDLVGLPVVERNFFENYLLPQRFEFLPEGMLPMCYPSDHNDGVFIPNWAMWFVVELEEYAARSGDKEMVERLRPRVAKLLEYFKRFENEDGLLEKLQSWVFIEWSKANEFVQDVNYPSNMLYAGMLAAAGRMYAMPELIAKGQKIRETIQKQSWDGQFFVDNALRKDGRLEVTLNRSEVCQYFAFYFDVASPKTHPALWAALRDQFGPERAKTKAFADVHPANSFIGNVLRMEILSGNGRGQQILDESIAYLLYMADRTGTLWENTGAYASCNHGFASHVVHTLYRDVLGLYEVDRVKKRLRVRFNDLKMEWCEGRMPVGDGTIGLRWWKEGGRLAYRLSSPAGYQVEIENRTGRELDKR